MVGRQERTRNIDRPLRRAGLETLPGGVPSGVPSGALPVMAVGAATGYSTQPGLRFAFLEYEAPNLDVLAYLKHRQDEGIQRESET